jgi:hypothetical protein
LAFWSTKTKPESSRGDAGAAVKKGDKPIRATERRRQMCIGTSLNTVGSFHPGRRKLVNLAELSLTGALKKRREPDR